MPETARILRFPERRRRVGLSPEDARGVARRYLNSSEAEWSELGAEGLSDPDVLLNVIEGLRENGNLAPSKTALQAERVYSFIESSADRVGIFDERDYFLGSAALIAGGANRLLGKREDAENWLDRAEAAFRHTVNPGPSLASVAYARLAILYDARSYARVINQVPGLLTSLVRFGMKRDELKTRFLQALTLKEMGRTEEALSNILLLARDPDLAADSQLSPVVSVHAAELLSEQRRYAEAGEHCDRILRSGSADQPLVSAHLKGINAVALREQGRLDDAVESFRQAIDDYSSAEMSTQAAYVRLILAETLIALSRYREAEWEILAALPTIEEQKMVPEGFAAVALLKESVRRRKTDPNALRELREHLQANR